MIDKDTQFCISLASKPSNFGTTLHNAAYAALGINFVYKAFEISDLTGAITGIRALNIRGCSVSMPFKEAVLPLLDNLDETAQLIGAVNTIVNDEGRLTGYNTDAFGARKVLEYLRAKPSDSVLVLGAGGAARAILFALRQIGFRKVRVCNRDVKKIQCLDPIMSCEIVPWEERHNLRVDILINATSVGMAPNANESPVDASLLSHARAVMDVVVSPMDSYLIKISRAMNKDVAPGYLMSLEQLIEQFRLYTNLIPPRAVIEQSMKNMIDSEISNERKKSATNYK